MGTPEVHATWSSCADATSPGPSAADAPPLTDSFTPVAAVICRSGTEARLDQVQALVDALTLPASPVVGDACTADLWMVPALVLLDADGRWIQPGIPLDDCRKPRPELRVALEAFPQQVTPREERPAGCESAFADVIAMQAASTTTTTASVGGYLPAADARVQLCVYAVPESEQGSGKPRGDFIHGEYLDAATWAKVRRELPAVGVPGKECRAHAGRFARLFAEGVGDIAVELDGCRRIAITARNALIQGTPELSSVITELL